MSYSQPDPAEETTTPEAPEQPDTDRPDERQQSAEDLPDGLRGTNDHADLGDDVDSGSPEQ